MLGLTQQLQAGLVEGGGIRQKQKNGWRSFRLHSSLALSTPACDDSKIMLAICSSLKGSFIAALQLCSKSRSDGSQRRSGVGHCVLVLRFTPSLYHWISDWCKARQGCAMQAAEKRHKALAAINRLMPSGGQRLGGSKPAAAPAEVSVTSPATKLFENVKDIADHWD